MGTFAVVLVARCFISLLLPMLAASSWKKWVSLLMKLGQTQTKSMSLLFDLRSSTWLPKGSSRAEY